MDLGEIATLVSVSTQVVQLLKGRPHSSRDPRAMASLYTAVEQTGKYIGELQVGGSSRSTERHLAGLWRKAADALERIDYDLSSRLRWKSDYWMNPREWPEKRVDRQRIGFNTIKDELDALMKTSA